MREREMKQREGKVEVNIGLKKLHSKISRSGS